MKLISATADLIESTSAGSAWWGSLPADDHRHPFNPDLDRSDRLKVVSTATADQPGRTALGPLMTLALASRLGTARTLEREALSRVVEKSLTPATTEALAPPNANIMDNNVERHAASHRLSSTC